MAQGVAEVVPVSSSAQLVLLPWLLGWEQPPDRTAFAAGLHAGSCLGIAVVLRHDLRALDRRTVALLAGSCLPAAVAGALAADRVEQRLGRPPQLAVLLAAAGVVLWLADRRAGSETSASDLGPPKIIRRSPSDTPGESDGNLLMIKERGGGDRSIGPREAGLAALAPVAARAPGVSRSGATLTALRATGVERAAAQRFSLLMSLPVTAGAAVLTLARSDRTALPALLPSLAVGATCAALAGAAATWTQQRRPGRGATGPALYRLVLAAVVARRVLAERRSSRKDPS